MLDHILTAAKPILWLSSYPKSGNTWIRFIVFHLVHGRQPGDSRELDRAINSKPVGPDPTSPAVKKSHASLANISSLVASTNRAIYVYRHPLDVLQSSLNYAALTGEFSHSDQTRRREWIRSYIEHGGHPPWIEAPFSAGTWLDNVEGWMADTPFPVLRIGYEQALEDPAGLVADIAGFLEIDVGEAGIAACVDATSFASLREFEAQELARAEDAGKPQGRFSGPERQQAWKDGVRFFNKGQAGAYSNSLAAAEIDAAWDVFGRVAETLGYSK